MVKDAAVNVLVTAIVWILLWSLAMALMAGLWALKAFSWLAGNTIVAFEDRQKAICRERRAWPVRLALVRHRIDESPAVHMYEGWIDDYGVAGPDGRRWFGCKPY